MDDISQYLAFLRDAGVDVMFRPLHEMNRNCFWWGGRPGPNGSRRLYQITHDYLKNVKGLDNLVWTWNLQDEPTLAQDVIDYNPGSQYWEVATLDVYSGFETSKYDVMRSVAGSKPFAIGECGKLPDATRLASENQWAFFMGWSDLTFTENTDAQIRALFNSNHVITLDEMPGNWKSTPPASVPAPPVPAPPVPAPPVPAPPVPAPPVPAPPVPAPPVPAPPVPAPPVTAPPVPAPPVPAPPVPAPPVPAPPVPAPPVLPALVLTPGVYSLRSAYNTYLSGGEDGSIRLVSHPAQDWDIVSVNDGSANVYLRSSVLHGTYYLSAWSDGSVRFMPHANAWEQWTPVWNHQDSTVSYYSVYHGKYLSAWPSQGTVRLWPHNQSYEHFTMEVKNYHYGDDPARPYSNVVDQEEEYYDGGDDDDARRPHNSKGHDQHFRKKK
jgi:hypothetical protein